MSTKSTEQNTAAIWEPEWEKENSTSLKMFFNHRVFLESYPAFKKYLVGALKDIRFLEVGAGSGRHGLQFAIDFPEMEITMTDLSIENLLSKKEELNLTKLKIEVADAAALPYIDNSFDVVFSDAAIQYMKNYEKAVSEMSRVLKPGGMIILSVINWWNLPHLLDKKFLGDKYPWGYEKSFTKNELNKLVRKFDLEPIANDGYAPAYGVFRLKHRHSIFRLLGRMLSKTIKIADPHLGNIITRNFGFYIFTVAIKKHEEN